MQSNFQPSAITTPLSCTSVTGNAQITGGSGSSIEVWNSGAVVAFIAFGTTNSVTALTTGYPVQPGVIKMISVPQESRWVAGITSSGTATIYLTPGEGS